MKNYFLLPLLVLSFISSTLTAAIGVSFYDSIPADSGYTVYLPNVTTGGAQTLSNNPPAPVPVLPAAPADFVASVTNGNASEVRGVYVEGALSLPVIQQPSGQAGFVSEQNGVVTQFAPAAERGTIGLLAHNFLAGDQFFSLEIGDDVIIVYGDGSPAYYRVTEIQSFQALEPNNYYSNFVDLNDPQGTQITSTDVFNRVYAPEGRVVFQTCIEANGDPSWGRLFVVAEKVN